MKDELVKAGESKLSVVRKRLPLIAIISGFTVLAAVLLANGVRAGRLQMETRDVSTADPSTQLPEHKVTFDDFVKMKTKLSNWGRWGKNDERGTLNLITPEKTLAALRLIHDGVVVSLAHFASFEKGVDSAGATRKVFMFPGIGWNKPRAMAETIEFSIHDGTDSHMDAICHYESQDGKFLVYNGHPAGFSEQGCQADSIERMGQAFATRGILVDIPLMRGVKYLDPKTAIYASDLEAWEKFAHVKIGSGDVVLIRGGRWAYRAEHGPFPYGAQGAGLHVSALPWLKERDIALLGSDAVNDVQPSGVVGGTGTAPGEMDRPIHNLALVYMGMPLVDNGYLEDVAREAAARKRWEFFVAVTPNRIEHGSASPFNAQAIF